MFDPRQYGATPITTPVKATSPDSFDPTKYGAVQSAVPTEEPGLISRGISAQLDITKNLATGVAKGIGSTVYGMAKTGEKIADITGINAILDGISRKFGVEPSGIRVGEEPKALEAQGITQKIGKGAEQVAELFTPIGLEAKAAGLIGKVLPKVVKETPAITRFGVKAATVGAKALGSATEFAGKTMLQTGDEKKALESGALAGGFSGLESLIKIGGAPVKEYLAKIIAPTLINRFLKPGIGAFRFGKNPGKQVAEEGIVVNTLGGFYQKVNSLKGKVGALIDTNLAPIKGNVNVEKIILPELDKQIAKAASSGEKALAERLVAIRDGLTTVYQSVEGKVVAMGEKNLSNMSALEANKLKQQIGEATKWTGQAFDDAVNQVRTKMYGLINDAVELIAPGSKKLNMRYGNLLEAAKALERQVLNSLAGKGSQASISKIGTAAITGGLGLAVSGGDPVKALLGGILGFVGAGAGELSQTAAFRTRLAAQLAKLDPEETALLTGVIQLLRNITSVSVLNNSNANIPD